MIITGTVYYRTVDGGVKHYSVVKSVNLLPSSETDLENRSEDGSLVPTTSTAKKSFELSMIP